MSHTVALVAFCVLLGVRLFSQFRALVKGRPETQPAEFASIVAFLGGAGVLVWLFWVVVQ